MMMYASFSGLASDDDDLSSSRNRCIIAHIFLQVNVAQTRTKRAHSQIIYMIHDAIHIIINTVIVHLMNACALQAHHIRV